MIATDSPANGLERSNTRKTQHWACLDTLWRKLDSVIEHHSLFHKTTIVVYGVGDFQFAVSKHYQCCNYDVIMM